MSNIFEYATGSDSFRANGAFEARSVTLTALVYNPKSGFFENPRSLTKDGNICKVEKVHTYIPASSNLRIPAGNWYYYRAEARFGSLWCLEYRRMTSGSFQFITEVLLVRFSRDAEVVNAELNFPPHPLANVPKLSFTWRPTFIKEADDLSMNELAAFKKLTGETSDFVVPVTQGEDELPSWTFSTVEKAAPRKAIRSPKSNVAVARVRRLKL